MEEREVPREVVLTHVKYNGDRNASTDSGELVQVTTPEQENP